MAAIYRALRRIGADPDTPLLLVGGLSACGIVAIAVLWGLPA